MAILTDDAVHLPGEQEAARSRSGRRIDDGAFEGFLERDDLELFRRVVFRIDAHHGSGEMPVGLLMIILRPVRIGPVDVVEHLGQITLAVPALQAVVNDRAEGQVGIALERHQLVDVAPLAGHTTVAEQPPHRIGGGHQFAHTATPVAAAAGAA